MISDFPLRSFLNSLTSCASQLPIPHVLSDGLDATDPEHEGSDKLCKSSERILKTDSLCFGTEHLSTFGLMAAMDPKKCLNVTNHSLSYDNL